jgi:rhamnose utilization protein RhaD (predicted bifunctional aldolase and dehydrogenase)
MVRSDLWRELCAVSARLGADRAIVQGAGGNVSLKEEGTLWVKASGCWLADAEAKDIMVPLALEAVRHRLADGAG